VSLSEIDDCRNRDGALQPRAVATTATGLSLWLCPLVATATQLERLAAMLSDAERHRAARFGTAELRSRYVVGRATLRSLLAAAIGRQPAEVPLRRGSRGRPELDLPEPPLDFNVSHTRDVALIGFLRAGGRARVGVDIERLDRQINADRLARRYLTEQERERFERLDADARRQRFIELWTCKEAISKATGAGLSAPMGRIGIELDDGPRLAAGPPPYSPPDWELWPVRDIGGYVATAAIWARSADAKD
jgi:4'-phosphopantetheinyl transferase